MKLVEAHFVHPLPFGIGKACGVEAEPKLGSAGTETLSVAGRALVVPASNIACLVVEPEAVAEAEETKPETPGAKAKAAKREALLYEGTKELEKAVRK